MQLSPDGDWLALSVASRRQSRPTGHAPFTAEGVPVEMLGSRVLLVQTTTGEVRDPFPDAQTSWAPRWSPDGRRLVAYVQHDGPPCLGFWQRDTGQVRLFHHAPVHPFFGFEIPQWLPDSRAVVVKLQPAIPSTAEGTTTASPAPASVKVFSYDPARSNQEQPLPAYVETYRCDLGLVDLDTGVVRRIATDWALIGWRVAPNGQAVAVLRANTTSEQHQQVYDDLVILPLDGTTPRIVARRVAQEYGVGFAWSPDSRWIAYTSAEPGSPARLYVAPADGQQEPSQLCIDPPVDLSQSYEAPRWSADGQHITCLTAHGIWFVPLDGSSARLVGAELQREIRFWLQHPLTPTLDLRADQTLLVATRDATTKREGLATVDLADGHCTMLLEVDRTWSSEFASEIAPDGSSCYLVSETADQPSALLRLDCSTRRIATLFALNTLPPTVALGTSRLITYQTPDGRTCHGALLLPPGYVAGQRVPLLVHVYGGSDGSNRIHRFGFGGAYYDNAQLLAAQGYAVLYPDLPLGPRDPLRQIPGPVLAAINQVVALGIADPDRLGVLGQSYGGYTVLALLVQTQRFRAAVACAGMANLTSIYGVLSPEGDNPLLGWCETGQRRLGGSLWEQRPAYIENSPIFYLDRVRTPLLLIYGLEDFVPPAQGGEVFSALRRLGVRVELRYYQGEDHWPGFWSERNLREVCVRVLAWFRDQFGTSVGGTE